VHQGDEQAVAPSEVRLSRRHVESRLSQELRQANRLQEPGFSPEWPGDHDESAFADPKIAGYRGPLFLQEEGIEEPLEPRARVVRARGTSSGSDTSRPRCSANCRNRMQRGKTRAVARAGTGHQRFLDAFETRLPQAADDLVFADGIPAKQHHDSGPKARERIAIVLVVGVLRGLDDLEVANLPVLAHTHPEIDRGQVAFVVQELLQMMEAFRFRDRPRELRDAAEADVAPWKADSRSSNTWATRRKMSTRRWMAPVRLPSSADSIMVRT